MEHFLLQLTKTSAIGGAVIALLLTLRPFLGKRYRARMYYWLWLVLAVALLPSPVYTGANAPVQITPPSEHVMVWTDKAAIVPKISHKDNFVTVPDGVTPALSHIQPGDDFTQRLPSTPIRRIVDVSSVLFLAWLAGVAIFLTVQGVGYGRFRRLAHRWSEPLKNDRYGEFLREEASALGLTAPKVALCPAVSTPALTGLIRPKLLLPHEDYTEIELRFILRHELTHLKHRDILYKLILIFANALHWFNPLVYLMLRAADEDIELSCDSAVTRNMEKEERAAYSETLLKAVRSKGDTVVLTSCFGSTVERLKRRITNILDGRKKSRGVAVIVLAICTVAALGAAIGFAPAKDAGTPAKTQEETEREQSFTVDDRFAQTQAFSDALSAFSAEADAAEAIAYCPSGFSSTLGGLVTDSDLLRELKAALASIQPVSLTLSEEDARKIPLHSAGFILYDTVPEDSSPFQKPDYYLWNGYIVAAKDMSVVGQLNSEHRSTFSSAWNRQSHRNAERSADSEPTAPKPTAESIKASAASSVDYGGFLWFVADGYFSRYADTGSIEQLYELPLGYDDETPVFASISVIAAKIALSYHVGGAIMGYDELRLFDTQTGAQTHEISGYGSFAINGDTIVKTTGFMPPAAGNLRISRDCGKTWENLGDPKYLYGMSVTADGNTVSYRGEQGILSLHDDYLYIAGVDTSSWDGSSTQLPETLSLCINLETGETVERID